MMPPMTTIAAPVQNSHQVGPIGSAIPPTTKPMMMIAATVQEARPAMVRHLPGCLAGLRIQAVRSGISRHRRGCRLLGHSKLLSLVNAPIILREVRDLAPAGPWTPATIVRVRVRLGLVSHLAYDGMLGR